MKKKSTSHQAEEYRKEVVARWGEKALNESENNINKMSPAKWNSVKAEGDRISRDLAALMDQDPASAPVQNCIAAWHKFLKHFYPVSEERLRGLGTMYVEDERFTAHYDKYAKGLAKFKNMAIQIYCDNGNV